MTAKGGPPVRILVCDDHEVVRKGVRSLLEEQPGFTVVAEAGTAAEAFAEAVRTKPDVVVIDVRLPDGTGIEACRAIREELPRTRVLMLTSYSDEDAVVASIVAGAAGYLLKQVQGRALVEAIEKIASGASLLDPDVTRALFERVRAGGVEDPAFGSLTGQERRIMDRLARGLSNREIAGEMFLSEKTVKNYVSRILDKLGLRRRGEVAAYMARRGRQP